MTVISLTPYLPCMFLFIFWIITWYFNRFLLFSMLCRPCELDTPYISVLLACSDSAKVSCIHLYLLINWCNSIMSFLLNFSYCLSIVPKPSVRQWIRSQKNRLARKGNLKGKNQVLRAWGKTGWSWPSKPSTFIVSLCFGKDSFPVVLELRHWYELNRFSFLALTKKTIINLISC